MHVAQGRPRTYREVLWYYYCTRVVGSVLTRRTTLIGTWAVGLDP